MERGGKRRESVREGKEEGIRRERGRKETEGGREKERFA